MEILFESTPDSRYDRHHLISWWDQNKVSQANVLVAGAGALGNEVLKLLALIGVGHILIVDFDIISRSNLSRMILFREQDVGLSKVDVAVTRLEEINPEVEIIGVKGDLSIDVGLGNYRNADIVIGCLDSVNARYALNRKCQQAGVEWIDGGISDYHGLIARYSPAAGACYECNFTEHTIERFNQRYSCPFNLINDQIENKVPTTAVTTSVVAAIQVQQALMVIHDMDEGLSQGERLMVYLKPFHMIKDVLPFNHDCIAHYTLPKDIPVIDYSPDMLILDAIQAARHYLPDVVSLDLPFEYVIEFDCQVCSDCAPVLKPREKVLHGESICPKCGQLRVPKILTEIGFDSSLVNLSMSDVGIPCREVLSFSQGTNKVFLQIGK